MLDAFKKSKIDKNLDLKDEIKKMQKKLFVLQQKIKEKNIPVVILIDGLSGAGKGRLMGKIIARMEPRNYKVHTVSATDVVSERRPILHKYWQEIPSRGEIGIFDEGWYENTLDYLQDSKKKAYEYLDEINVFERQLADDGYCILKFFLHISKDEQEKRLKELDEDSAHKWQVTKKDWKENKNYKEHLELKNEICNYTNHDYAKWNIIWNEEKQEGVYEFLCLLVNGLENTIENHQLLQHEFKKQEFKHISMPLLKDVDLKQELSEEEYKERYKKEKEKLKELHSKIYAKKIPVVIAFEGWDAAGKGGSIRRLSWALDPRGLDVYSIAAPTKFELSVHYLYRFWNKLPKTGHIAIFDRSWYGRLMVERLEKFCEEIRWSKGYDEINEFEKSLTDFGAIVLKFFIHIDSDTQLQRFNERLENPEKAYKLTDEDWRNRDKWDVYEEAINDMLQKTSTENAPWIIVEGNDKKYARIKVLETVRKALEERV